MNLIVKNTLGALSAICSTKHLIKWSGQNNVFPFYHAVSDHKIAHISPLYRHKNTQEFEKDLDFLLKYYRPIGLEELLYHKKNKLPLKGVFHLSFDDGLSNFYDTIAPILKHKEIPATVFLNTAFVDNKKLFYRYKSALLINSLKNCNNTILNSLAQELHTEHHTETIKKAILEIDYKGDDILDKLATISTTNYNDYLKTQQPYLSSEQIKELIADGFTFGSHSIDHPLYNSLDINEQLRQTKESTRKISKDFQLDYQVFSFPFTDFGVSKKFFELCLHEENTLQLSFGCAGIKHDWHPQHIQRLDMEKTATSPEKIIKIELLYYLLKMCFNKNRIQRK